MSDKETGGPAFPCGESYQTRDLAGCVTNHSKGPLKAGMTLRDYFAASALQGILSHVIGVEGAGPDGYAERAYTYADAMIKARGKVASGN